MKHQRKEPNPPSPRLTIDMLGDIAVKKYQVMLCMIMRPPCMSFCSLSYTQTMNRAEIAVEKLLFVKNVPIQSVCQPTRVAFSETTRCVGPWDYFLLMEERGT
jgi:hypothetical protein